MELRDLDVFLDCARTEHFGRAADARHMSQSAISKAIGRVEDELKVPLFDRQGRVVRLNRYGHLFRTHVEDALRSLQAGYAAVADATDPDQGEVALAFVPSLGPTLIPRLVQKFRTTYPKVRFLLSQGGAENVVTMLESGQVDLCLTSPDPERPGVEWTPLWTERLVLVTPPGETRTDWKGPTHLHDVGDRPFVALKAGYGLRKITDALCAEAKIRPRIVFEGADVPTVRGIVGAGLGIAVLPPAAGPERRWSPPETDLADAGAERTIGIAHVRGRYLPVAARRLHALLIEQHAHLLKARFENSTDAEAGGTIDQLTGDWFDGAERQG
ncbi:LysR family transcriptional regulator [Saccharopolyspora spinosa]|uniref:DNA-binding transcriptional LysR family regulator n=1 Tax=Saccharopolyspora spinosa TaxID=60894 RepID=A0A2N3Y180_SACSN|nr:LysR family transcriptional regulator [Saccharopolyspora spinosa]PKW16669.1 DNA-binding transcriptional LysR family regulator [Saccharopolyspora spinosa]